MPYRKFTFPLLGLAVLFACGQNGMIGEYTSDTEAQTVGSSGTTGTPVGTGCPADPRTSCEASQVDCTAWNCGDKTSPFDENGCLRRACTDSSQCEPEGTCIVEFSGGGCPSPGAECGPDAQGVCDCGFEGVCGGWCAVIDCEKHLTKSGCEAEDPSCVPLQAGEVAIENGECVVVSSDRAWCYDEAAGGSAAPSAWYEVATGRVFGFGVIPIGVPEGWLPCGCDPPAPEACKCTSNLMGPLNCDGETGTSSGG